MMCGKQRRSSNYLKNADCFPLGFPNRYLPVLEMVISQVYFFRKKLVREADIQPLLKP